MQTTYDAVSHHAIEAAFPHALTMAEAGNTIQLKRTGYLFCVELMPAGHELQLMLVNTLRKDLENPEISRICLALDTLVACGTEDVIPAIQPRLLDLLSHNSPIVRRRALVAVRALSRHDSELLVKIATKLIKRMKDPHMNVARAAVLVSTDLVKNASNDQVQVTLEDLLQTTWTKRHDKLFDPLLLLILRALSAHQLADDAVNVAIKLIRATSEVQSYASMYGAFTSLREYDFQNWPVSLRSARFSPVQYIRPLLTSRDVNDQYAFLACLECVDPALWAGTWSEIKPVLEAWEVEHVMGFLDSPDDSIRRKTLRILIRVDSGIVDSCYDQLLTRWPSVSGFDAQAEFLNRALEVLDIRAGSSGELFASYLKELFRVVQASPALESQVFEAAVLRVMIRCKEMPRAFNLEFATALLTSVTELDTPLASTLLVIATAYASEYCGKIAVPPKDILRGLAVRLPFNRPTVQDACLLAMIRVAADCDDIPADATEIVSNMMQGAGKRLQKRCRQFLALSSNKGALIDIVRGAASASLPDFSQALQRFESSPLPSLLSSPSQSQRSLPQSSHRTDTSGTKLRYAAYEAPQTASSFRRHFSGSERSGPSSPSLSATDHLGSPKRLMESLSRTITPGEHSFAAGTEEIEMSARAQRSTSEQIPDDSQVLEDITSRVDLIAFDSPLTAHVISAEAEGPDPDFESTWNALDDSSGARGWCEMPLEDVVQQLQTSLDGYHLRVIPVDCIPFQGMWQPVAAYDNLLTGQWWWAGELKIMVSGTSAPAALPSDSVAVLRLRANAEDGCLWRLKCAGVDLRTRVKRVLTGDA
ncbi:hypothetical protein HGRIS_002322 [Hohenbuehelia grisea]|uniref:Clathrin/coatomer adaptor adaptin-like N-terminal domain-containing protein n=1 Tax=Hohenbuehelia grisea TaxID=104357 RepID=A0ABR3JLC3_9AGAR